MIVLEIFTYTHIISWFYCKMWKNIIIWQYWEAIFIQIIDDERTTIHRYDFLTQTCSLCGQKMLLSEGDMIYGDKWYHNSCWNLLEQNNIKHNISSK